MFRDQDKLLETLLNRKILTKSQVVNISKESKITDQSVEDIILNDGLLTSQKLTTIKASLMDVPPIDLQDKVIAKKILELIPEEVALNYRVIAFGQNGREVHFAMVDPYSFKAREMIDLVAKKNGLQIRSFIVSNDGFEQAAGQYRSVRDVETSAIGIGTSVQKIHASVQMQGVQKTQHTEQIPVAKMALVILRHAIDGGATDIHIEPEPTGSRVRYRIDGALKTTLVVPRAMHTQLVNYFKTLAGITLEDVPSPCDGRASFSIDDRSIDFHLNTLPLSTGEKIVLKIVGREPENLSLEKLGFLDFQTNLIYKALETSPGLVLLAGPVGSGKTKTIYAILHDLNYESSNIATIEDPINYYIPGINQSQVDKLAGYNLLEGLEATIKQDPDVVMIDRLSQPETVALALQVGVSGRNILAKIHTQDAISAIARLRDFGAQSFMIASGLSLIIASRQVKKICPNCKVEDDVSPSVFKKFKKQFDKISAEYKKGVGMPELTFYRGRGCAYCGDRGYTGQIVVSEVVPITSELREAIIEDLDINNDNFITLSDVALLKAARGDTSVDEVLRIFE